MVQCNIVLCHVNSAYMTSVFGLIYPEISANFKETPENGNDASCTCAFEHMLVLEKAASFLARKSC